MAKAKKATEPKAKKKAGKAAAVAPVVTEESVIAELPVEATPTEATPPVETAAAPTESAPATDTDVPAAQPKHVQLKKPTKTKAAKPAKDKKPSALDAAAQILEMANQPMNCAEMIEAMDRRGLWSSPNGKTPAATLYSALLREINTKGKDSRFVKAERGTFTRK